MTCQTEGELKVATGSTKNNKRRFFISGPGKLPIIEMFSQRGGYEPTLQRHFADFFVFTGGADINPKLYGESPIKGVFFSSPRDEEDISNYKYGYGTGKFLVGICRGAQFLNVMKGGSLWQDVDGHTKDHDIKDCISGEIIGPVTSTHHQMMRIGTNARVIAKAAQSQIIRNESCRVNKVGNKNDWEDPEVVAYYGALCFQPHPEYRGEAGLTTRGYFFQVFENLINEWETRKKG